MFVSSLDYNEPGAAASRHLAYFRGLIEAGVAVDVMLLGKSKEWSPGATLPIGVRFIPLGSASSSRVSRSSRLLQSARRVRRFKMTALPTGIIFLYSNPYALLPILWACRDGAIPLLHERTEHPDVLGPRRRIDKWIYEKACLPRFDGVYAITEPLLSVILARSGGSTAGRVVNMIVDTSRFEDDLSRKSRNAGEIVYVGSLNFAKDGVDLLIRALARVRSMRGTEEAFLSLYGLDEDSASLEEVIRDAGLSRDQVVLHGTVAASRIPTILQHAEVVAMGRPDSTQAQFGFPTKLGEYLASGTPTVATSVGEISRFLVNGENAYLAIPGSIQSLSSAMHRALTDPGRFEVATKGRHLAEVDFGRSGAAEEICELVEECRGS